MKKINYKTLIIMVIIFITIIPTFSKAAKVTVGQVKGVKVTSKETTTIKLSWNKVSKATGYRVYMYNSSKKKYEYLGKTNGTSYTMKKLKTAQEYKIKIRAYRTLKNKNYYGSYSSVITTTTKPIEVNNLKATAQSDTMITLSWDKVTRASGYKVYAYNTSTKKYEEKASVSKNSAKITELTQAKTYKIKVRAYKTVNKKNYYGAYSKVITTFTKPTKVIELKVSNASINSINLTWNKVSGATGYQVYKYNSSSKKYEYQGETKENKFYISNLNSATGYNFKVRAYITYNNTKYYGAYSEVLDTATYPNKVLGLKVTEVTTDSIEIEWNRVEEAGGYEVYVYRESGQAFKKYQATRKTTMKITDLEAAKFYKIYVKAYATINNKNYYSENSDTISERTVSTNTSKAGIDVSQHQGTIDWNEVKSWGVDFAILRLGWIGNKENHTLDAQFERNYSECKRLGIPVGVYVYCYSNCSDTAKSGSNWVVKHLTGKTLDLPVFIDMEDKSIVNTGKENLSSICIEFNNIISVAGFEPGIYANKNWFDNYLDRDLKSKYTCWIAHYTSSEKVNYEGLYKIWQYSSTGLIDGINGNVDLDIMYVEGPAE